MSEKFLLSQPNGPNSTELGESADQIQTVSCQKEQIGFKSGLSGLFATELTTVMAEMDTRGN